MSDRRDHPSSSPPPSPSPSPSPSPARNSREEALDRILVEYFEALDAGVPVDRDRLYEKYPELAGMLEEVFASEEAVSRLECRVADAARRLLSEALSTPFESGARLGGYVIVEEIGRGGTGIVYRALDPELGREVALKVFFPERCGSPEERRRVRAEAEAAAALEHPGIVPVYQVGEDEGISFITMRRIDGETLSTKQVELRGRWHDIAILIEKVARAVAYAHRRNVIHRDLKPGNILIDRDGEPWVTDFGHAKLLEPDGSVSDSAARIGTPLYVAPEQLVSKRGSKRSLSIDVHALGAILYELLTGRAAYSADATYAILKRIAEDAPDPPRHLVRSIPRDLETICLHALEKDPSRRYGSAEAFADDVARFREGRPLTARPVNIVERGWKWMRRHPSPVWASAVTLVLIVVVTSSFFQRSVSPQQSLAVHHFYADRIQSAAGLLAERYPERARELLASIEHSDLFPKQVGLEWEHLRLRVDGYAGTLEKRAPFLSFAATGRVAGLLADEKTLWLRESILADGERLFPSPPGTLLDLRLSADGERLLAVSDRSLFEYATAELSRPLRRHSIPVDLGGSREDPRMARISEALDRVVFFGAGHDVVVIDSATGGETARRSDPVGFADGALVGSILFGPSGDVSRRPVRKLGADSVWGWVSLEPVPGLEDHGLVAATRGMSRVALSPDGQRLAVARVGPETTLRVLSFPAGTALTEEIRVPHVRDSLIRPRGFVWDRSGGSLALGLLDGRVLVWDPVAGKAPWAIECERAYRVGDSAIPNLLTFDPTGSWLVAETYGEALRVHDIDCRPVDGLASNGGTIWEIALAAGGTRVVSASDFGDVAVIGVSKERFGVRLEPLGTIVLDAKRRSTYYVLSPRADRVAWEWDHDGVVEVRRIELEPGKFRAPLEARLEHPAEVCSATFATAGDRLFVADRNGRVVIWERHGEDDVEGAWREARSFSCGFPRIRAIALARNRDLLALGTLSADRFEVRRASDGAFVFEHGLHGSVAILAFDPEDRRLAVATRSGLVHIYDAESWVELVEFHAHDETPRGLVFSPDGRRLFTAGDDGRVSIWRLQPRAHDGALAALHLLDLTAPGPECTTKFLALPDDGSFLAAGGFDGSTGGGRVTVWSGAPHLRRRAARK